MAVKTIKETLLNVVVSTPKVTPKENEKVKPSPKR